MRPVWIAALALLCVAGVTAQEPVVQLDASREEFAARRAKVFEAIGAKALAVVQSAPNVDGFRPFRQSNEFYYLTGLEVPHALLMLDGRNKRTMLFLSHRDEARDANEGKTLSAEDGKEIRDATGIEGVRGIEFFARDHVWTLVNQPVPALYTPFSPAERGTDSRDELNGYQAGLAADPWDGRPSREGHFLTLLRGRFPQFELKDLTPVLDQLRSVKSKHEIARIRRASQIAGYGLLEAMRSTRPNAMEYELDAVAKYVFQTNGARRDAYNSITAGGTNAYMGHYFRNADALKAGEMVLMDYAPEFRYYTSDVTRMWPVSGTYSKAQRQLADFILAYRNALLQRIKPGVLPEEVLDGAAEEMQAYLKNATFERPAHRAAAEAALKFRGHLSHPVGMAVHDVGPYRPGPFKPGHVFSVDPMLWVHEERLYVRMEDVVVVTETGVENFTSFLASSPDEIERVMKEDGILQLRPPSPVP